MHVIQKKKERVQRRAGETSKWRGKYIEKRGKRERVAKREAKVGEERDRGKGRVFLFNKRIWNDVIPT